jgi:hypothetical protein
MESCTSPQTGHARARRPAPKGREIHVRYFPFFPTKPLKCSPHNAETPENKVGIPLQLQGMSFTIPGKSCTRPGWVLCPPPDKQLEFSLMNSTTQGFLFSKAIYCTRQRSFKIVIKKTTWHGYRSCLFSVFFLFYCSEIQVSSAICLISTLNQKSV